MSLYFRRFFGRRGAYLFCMLRESRKRVCFQFVQRPLLLFGAFSLPWLLRGRGDYSRRSELIYCGTMPSLQRGTAGKAGLDVPVTLDPSTSTLCLFCLRFPGKQSVRPGHPIPSHAQTGFPRTSGSFRILFCISSAWNCRTRRKKSVKAACSFQNRNPLVP